jgi:hypothetical protein
MKNLRSRVLCFLVPVLCLIVLTESRAQQSPIQDPNTSRVRALDRETPPVVLGANSIIVGDGYLVAGELWETVRPPNSAGPNETGQNKRYMMIVGCGQGGDAWREPTTHWPGGWFWTNNWRNGGRMFIGAYDNDPTFNPATVGGVANPNHVAAAGPNYSLAFYSNKLPGADPTPTTYPHTSARDYAKQARWVDPVTGNDETASPGSIKRHMMVFEFGFPTTIGVDVKVKARQYTMNWQNMNDFIVYELTLTNTGVVDINGDGTPEKTNHRIQGLAVGLWQLPGIAVGVGTNGARSSSGNWFGAGRNYGYVGDNDPKTGAPTAAYVVYPGVNPNNILADGTVPAGKRDMGINAYSLRNYTDVWNAYQWLAVKRGANGRVADADKTTAFGSHPVGTGSQKGWYTSTVDADKFFGDLLNPKNFFMNATATWRADRGRENDPTRDNLGPNPNYFTSGTGEDITTWVPKASPSRPDGDRKFAGFAKFPPLEGGWTSGFSDHEDFNGEFFTGVGPFSMEVNETITVILVEAAGYRLQGIQGALRAADFAWQNGWNVFSQLPNTPDLKVENTAAGSAIIRWTESAAADGFKIWKASQFKKLRYQDLGMRIIDRYQEQKTVGADVTNLLQPINPNFDATAYIATEQGYQPDGWGTYDLVAVIPRSEASKYADNSVAGFQYAYEDKSTILGFRYWYYVAAYKNGTFAGPGGTSTDQIETSNFTRNGRDGFWKGTYPFAIVNTDFPAATNVEGLRRIGAVFTVRSPASSVTQLNAGAIKVGVRPNPYKRAAYFDNRQDFADHKVAFYNLPATCRITIVDVTGQLIDQIRISNAPDGVYFWNMFSKDGIEVASGLYVYLVEWENGSTRGYFSILR